jgi:hypothetical protein
MKKLILLLILFASPLWAATYYVDAIDGDNADNGTTWALAWATPHYALTQVQGSGVSDTIIVDGDFYFTTTLDFGAADTRTAGTILYWEVADGNTASFNGSVKLTGDQFTDGGDIESIDLSAQAYTNVSWVFLNGDLMECARVPDKDYSNDRGGVLLCDTTTPDSATQLIYKVGELDASGWANEGIANIHAWSGINYVSSRRGVSTIHDGSRTITLDSGVVSNFEPYDRFYIYNVFEELDDPNEWYWNSSTETLYIWPGYNLDASDVVSFTELDRTVHLAGCDYIDFNSITIGECYEDAIVVDGSSTNITIQNCTIKNAYWRGVKSEDSTNLTVTLSEIYDVGWNGIRTYDSATKYKNLTDGGLVFSYNTLHDTGIVLETHGGAIYITGVGHDVIRNTIYDVPRMGIRYDGNNHIIEKNYIYNAGRLTEDMGLIYGGGQHLTYRGNIIRYNYCNATGAGYGHGTDGVYDRGVSYGLYSDDGQLGDTFHGNLVIGAERGNIQNHGGGWQTYTNNILVGSPKDQQIHFSSQFPASAVWDELDDVNDGADGWNTSVLYTAYPALADLYRSMDPCEVGRDITIKRNVIVYPGINTHTYNWFNNWDMDYFDVNDNFVYSGTIDWRSRKDDIIEDWATWTARGQDGDTINLDDYESPYYTDQYQVLWNATDANVIYDLNDLTYVDVNNVTVTSVTLLPWTGAVLLQQDTPEDVLGATQYYQKLTIDKTKVGSGGTTNYEFHITRDMLHNDVVDPNGSATMQANGGDVRFTDGTNKATATQYACDIIESGHDTGTGAGNANIHIVVMIPTGVSSATDKDVYMWFNTAGASVQPSASSSYGSENAYRAAKDLYWPLYEDPNGGGVKAIDRTDNNNDGTADASMTTADLVVGKVGRAWDFDGTNDTIQIASYSHGAPMSFMAWVNCDDYSLAGGRWVWNKRPDGSNDSFNLAWYATDSGLWYNNIYSGASSIGDAAYDPTPNPTDGQWYFVAGTTTGVTSGDVKLYIDDTNVDSDTLTGNMNIASNELELAQFRGAGFWEGPLDEAQIFEEVLTTAYLLTYYNNTASPSTFIDGVNTPVVESVALTTPRIIIIGM